MINDHPLKYWVIGKPLRSEQLEGQLLPKRFALPIFASDALSSVAYGPQELLLILSIGGIGFLAFAPWIAAAVVVVLVTVVASYRQLIRAYPSGGGDFEVAHRNLGEKAGLVVASALALDYILTVAVSVASGVDNIISAFPALHSWRVELAVGAVVALALMNLRGVRESSAAFALPVYLFIGSLLLLVVVGLLRTAFGDAPVAGSAQYGVDVDELTQVGAALLLFRAFASGCSALTGVEAVANGVPAFRPPKVRNAQATLTILGAIAVVLFAGVTALALISRVHYVEDPCRLIGWEHCTTHPQLSVIAQLAAGVFGANQPLFYLVQATTAAVLLLAANTAFNGFPILASILAREKYAPKALKTRGDRLVFSNGVLAVAAGAIVLLLVYRASLTGLIQLYIIGVFVSFTLGQSGLVRHWLRMLRDGEGDRRQILRSLSVNAFGATLTAAVLLIVIVTKFTHGAWLVFVIMPILFALMLGVNRYYRQLDQDLAVDSTTEFGAQGDSAIVLVGRMEKPMLKALDYAIAARHERLEAVHCSIDDAETAQLERDWATWRIRIPLRVLRSPYREVAVPLVEYIQQHRAAYGPEVVTVYIPQYVVGHWWERLLHNRRAKRLRHALMLVHGVTVALVPWLLDSSQIIGARKGRPLPGQDRRGVPARPMVRTQVRVTIRRRR